MLFTALVAGFAACFALHLAQSLRGRLAWVPVYVRAAPEPAGFPSVLSFWAPEIPAATSLGPGDEILAAGGQSLRGQSRLGFLTRVYAGADASRRVALGVRSGGRTREAVLELLPVPLSWRTSAFAFAFVAIGALTFWRTRGFGPARLFFACAFCYGLHWCYFWGGSPLQTVAGIAAFTLGPALALPLALRAVLSFPEECASRGLLPRVWPWFFAPAALGGATWAFGLPLPIGWGLPLAIGGSAVWALALLAILTRNYRRSGPTGRRQIKWVLLGFYLGLVPPLLCGAATLVDRGLWWLYELSLISVFCIPLGLFVAISRDHLYDVDRLISAAATYTILSVLGIAGLLLAVPQVARAGAVFLDPAKTQLALSLGIALAVVGLRGRVDPLVQRLLFREREALERGALALRRDLAGTEKPSELLELLGERLVELLEPVCAVVYLAAGEDLSPVYARGPAAAPRLDPDGPLALRLSAEGAPCRVPARRRHAFWQGLAPEEASALDAMGAAVLAPLRQEKALAGLVCLGEKRSGDVYTETDLALLGSVADKVSDELDRFHERELHDAERAMSARLRRYVPGAVAAELEQGALPAGQRDVTVLFVDIRGYTSFAETRSPEAIFEAVSAYTRAVSGAVGECGGTVVEFNGDGMMAVFGAPRPHPSKERASIAAARAIRRAVAAIPLGPAAPPGARLEVGVGIATGPAYVGSIQGADRAIWSALGNTTNLAARLQALTRERGAAVALDEVTRRAAGDEARDFRSIGIVPIRGRSVPIEAFVLPLEDRP